MKTTIIIPARYASTRYPGKPLVLIRQPDGTSKSLIQMSWEAARAASGVDNVYVATDDDRIRTACADFGADVIMTSEGCINGTERCAEAVATLPELPELIVNLQGDAPLTPAWFVEALISAIKADNTISMATPVLRCDAQTYAHFTEDRKAGRVGGTTAVFDQSMNALYFSKEVLPYIDPGKVPSSIPVYHHVGIYAYRPSALRTYSMTAPSILEELEGLEQLRFLHAGISVRCVEVDARGRLFWELNNPTDVERIEAALEQT